MTDVCLLTRARNLPCCAPRLYVVQWGALRFLAAPRGAFCALSPDEKFISKPKGREREQRAHLFFYFCADSAPHLCYDNTWCSCSRTPTWASMNRLVLHAAGACRPQPVVGVMGNPATTTFLRSNNSASWIPLRRSYAYPDAVGKFLGPSCGRYPHHDFVKKNESSSCLGPTMGWPWSPLSWHESIHPPFAGVARGILFSSFRSVASGLSRMIRTMS